MHSNMTIDSCQKKIAKFVKALCPMNTPVGMGLISYSYVLGVPKI